MLKRSDKITIVTTTLPSRSEMLKEMVRSLNEQNMKAADHIIVVDEGLGLVTSTNAAIEKVETEYFCIVDDDDILYPNHIETLHNNLTADIVWTWCKVVGRDISFSSGYTPGRLQREPYITNNHAMNTKLFRDMGGWRHKNVSEVPHPDWDMQRRCERNGATFLNIPEVTWEYRFHGNNISMGAIST